MKLAKRIIFILVVIGLLWLAILLIARIFSGGSTNNTTTAPEKPLVEYAQTDAVAAMYIDGPVRADSERQALRISVSRSQVKAELINGYDGTVVRQEVFGNNPVAYASFLKALDKAGFDNVPAKTVSTDERGTCPLRNRFIYTIDDGSEEVMRAWTSSCGGGNFTGSHGLSRKLFLNQVPTESRRSILRDTGLSVN